MASASFGRRARIMIVALLSGLTALVFAPASAEAAEPWLDADFSGGVGGVFDSASGIAPTSNGHVGPGLVSRINAGNHWGSIAHWNTASHLGSEPEEMWIRYYLQFPMASVWTSRIAGSSPASEGSTRTTVSVGDRPPREPRAGRHA